MNFYIPPDFHFAKPFSALLFLLLIPIGYLFYQKIVQIKQCDLIFHQARYQGDKEFWNAFFLGLTFICLVLALMEPEAYKKKVNTPLDNFSNLNQPLPILFLLDTSLSMKTPDGTFNKPRIEQAKEIIDAFLPQLSAYPKALYTFQDHIQPLIPLTYDAVFINLTLDALSPTISKEGTDFVQVLQQLKNLLDHDNGVKPRQIVLLTDGEDTTPVPNLKEMEQLVSSISKEGITFTVIGLGSKEGLPIPDLLYHDKPVISHMNEELLREIAQAGEGVYVDPNHLSIHSLTQNLSGHFKQETYQKMYKENPRVTYTPLFPFFLLMGLLAFLRKRAA